MSILSKLPELNFPEETKYFSTKLYTLNSSCFKVICLTSVSTGRVFDFLECDF